MSKIKLENLDARQKKQLRVWEKQKPIIQIGNAYYEVEPVPAQNVLQFRDLVQLYTDYGTQYKNVALEETDEEQEEGQEKEKKQERDWSQELQGFLETVLESCYHLLKPFVPDLEEEDALDAPFGQVFHNLKVLVEINGLGWGEELLKEYIVPFVPSLLRSLLTLGEGAMRVRSAGESGSATPTSGSTSSPESPTDSTPTEP